jgi:2-polyprenyl-6-methoxyphenol hydroxylase-like FAD-dependent oxidoreductase
MLCLSQPLFTIKFTRFYYLFVHLVRLYTVSPGEKGSRSPVEQTSKSRPFQKVLIVGAGPAGLLLSLLLAQHSIPVLVLEAWSCLDSRLRATQNGTPAPRIFRKAGIFYDIRAVSIPDFKGIYWRTVRSERKLAAVDLSLTLDDPDRITVLPLSEILEILYRHCQKWNVEVKFEHKVLNVRQDKGKAWVEVEVGQENGDGGRKETFKADYVIGCDGATSRIRQELFGREWPGVT